MNEKIEPTWINDRLPTEKDGTKINSFVATYYLSGFNCHKILKVNQGTYWCNVPEDWGEIWPRNWQEIIATPQECRDKEKERGKQEKCVLTNKQLEEILGALHKSSNRTEAELRNKIKEVEQTLVREQTDHVQTMERVKELEEELKGANQCFKNKQEVCDMFRGTIAKYEAFIIKMAKGG